MKKINNKNNRIVSKSLFFAALIGLLLALIVSILAAVTFGNADISIGDAYSVISYEIFNINKFASFAEGAIHDVIWLIRLPRVILAVAIGMGLSVCGVVMQAVVKNSLADPYILGISSGASLGATVAIMLGIGSHLGDGFVGIMAFIGAMAATFAVLFISNIGGQATTGKLILSGMAISSVCSAFSSFALYMANNRNATAEVTYWTMGSLAGANWNNVMLILPVMIIGTLIFWTQFRKLNLMLLGDETAITLGTDLHKVRMAYMIIAALMVGFAVYSAGMIGFIGLIIPHTVRMVFGTDHRRLIPLSALLGSVFLVWADVGSRIILDYSEIPIGILVSMIGAPAFIYLMVRNSYSFGGGR